MLSTVCEKEHRPSVRPRLWLLSETKWQVDLPSSFQLLWEAILVMEQIEYFPLMCPIAQAKHNKYLPGMKVSAGYEL